MADDVAAPLPQVDLDPKSTLTVTLDVAGAVITRMSVHGRQVTAEEIERGSYLPTGPVLVPTQA